MYLVRWLSEYVSEPLNFAATDIADGGIIRKGPFATHVPGPLFAFLLLMPLYFAEASLA